MTNAESYLQQAIENRDLGKLNDWENNFITQFEGWDKKQLKSLSYKQFCTIRDIANK